MCLVPSRSYLERAKKQAEQVLKIGQRVLDADPEGVTGYNAFVNEPAEPQH